MELVAVVSAYLTPACGRQGRQARLAKRNECRIAKFKRHHNKLFFLIEENNGLQEI